MACLATLVFVVLVFISAVQCSLDYKECGESIVGIRARIIGGSQSRRGMWPWQIGIYKKKGSKFKLICSGALISPQWVLTTAHCFYTRRKSNTRIWYEKDVGTPSKYKVVAGDYNTKVKESSQQELLPVEIHTHPGYRHAPYYENDIALVKLNKSVVLGPFARTVCLPDNGIDLAKSGAVGMVAGWGKTRKSIRSSALRHAEFKIRSDLVCDRATNYFFNKTVTFCAGDGRGKRDTCHGDSGGSMMRNVLINGTLRWVVVGLVSWGEGCALKGNYGYYTRLNPFVDWIRIISHVQVKKDTATVKNLHGEGIEVKCRDGFDQFGIQEIGCRSEKWKIEVPICKARCPDPGVPDNGFLANSSSITTFTHGLIITFQCDNSYTISGQATLKCQNGRWSDVLPWCIAPAEPQDCSDPGTPNGGVRYDHSFKHNEKVRFACNSGWVMDGAGEIWCNNGVWSKPAPKCVGTVKKIVCNDYMPWSFLCR